MFLSLAPALYATSLMHDALPEHAGGWLQFGLLALFALLSCWVAAGVWTAMAASPSVSWSADSIESATRRRMSGLATSRSTTTSIVCL